MAITSTSVRAARILAVFVGIIACTTARASAESEETSRSLRKAAPALRIPGNLTSPLNTCGGNCPSNDCPSCPCGTSRNVVVVSDWCAKFGGWNQACCRCIAYHESGGNTNAANYNENGSFDVGLWQINDVNWGSCSGGRAPCDADTNLQCAIKVWQWGGNSFKLWSTCGACGCC